MQKKILSHVTFNLYTKLSFEKKGLCKHTYPVYYYYYLYYHRGLVVNFYYFNEQHLFIISLILFYS